MIAAVGLVTNSSVTVVASMLVSPLMGPILAVTFGAKIRDLEMVTRGVRNELCGAGPLRTPCDGLVKVSCRAPLMIAREKRL